VTFIAPGFLYAALAVAAGIVALHFIVTRQPRAAILPTARFVPDSPATAVVRDARPNDLLLMLLRVLIVFAAGAALARPVIKPSRQPVGRVFLVDVSRSPASAKDAVDSVKAGYGEGDAIIEFASTTRSLTVQSMDSIRLSTERGNLSAAILASLRAASEMRDRVDSVELVIVSPLMEEEYDAATDSIRKLWPGRARLIRTGARIDSVRSPSPIELRTNADDALLVSTNLANREGGLSGARFIRAASLTADDSAWITSTGRPVIVWPASEKPPYAAALPKPDVSGGVTADNARVVAAFSRRWSFPADSLRSARVVARWADGQPAAVEKRIANGCVRSVAIPVVPVGDLVIRPEFVSLVNTLAAPCGGVVSANALSEKAVASLTGSRRLAAGKDFAPEKDIPSPLAPWLLGLALVAAFGELFLRRRT
jgi:hypothetical protein